MKHTESSLTAGDTTPGTQDATPGLRPNRLGVVAIAFFVIAAAAPIAAVVGASPVLFSAIGPATPVIYTVAALVIALFSVGYLRMSRDITNAGGFVAYIATGLGTRWATGAAGVAVLTYVCLQAGLWAQFGVFADQLLTDLAAIDLPVYVWVALLLALTTLLTMRGVDASLKVLGVLIVGETCVIGVLVASTIAQQGWEIFSFGGFTTEHLLAPGLGISLLFAFTCFTSFEATVVFAEEARNPRRTIPRALYLVIAFVGFFYAISTWAISGAIGIDNIQTAATRDPSGFIFRLASHDAGQWLSIAMQILIVTSFVAMLLGLSNMFARYLFALGRAGSLPRRLSTTSPTGTPTNAALANGIAILVVITAFFALGADPITTVYAWLVALGTAGFITILILASLAIIVYFARQRPRTEILATAIAPILSCLIFIVIGYLTISNYDALLGGSGGIAMWLLLLIPASFAAGLIVASFKKSISYDSSGI
ncbi:amino acid transporter [Prauserella sediminis]|uniref:Amino acid transporter n=1 Tax=Prauserella sediminis TaxID=577680 RepID=A0A839XRF0_9PSEU|nr:APC family permease [Prauserella sediminis]MBB3664569.1 amino acid transporter [Prauserella sediminis]